MAKIHNIVDKIKTAVYGKDVRGSLADGIMLVNKEIEDNTTKQNLLENKQSNLETKQTTLDKKFDEQIKNMTLNNPSNAEIVAIRTDLKGKTHTNAGKRVDELESNLMNISETQVVADIDATTYKLGHYVDVEKLRSIQIAKYADFMRKIRTGNSVHIACKGDSMTYGTNSVDKERGPATTNQPDTGKTHTQYRANISYPEAMERQLKSVYGNDKITVTNLGYSGAYAQWHYQNYHKKRSYDLSLIMLGTNDSRLSSCPYAGNINEFIHWYEQLIIREIIWNKAVIILMPPKTKLNDIDVDTFSNALQLLGQKYCIPVVDSQEFTKNYNADIYSDNTHFTSEGYEIFATRVSALFMGEGLQNILTVKHGTTLLGREVLDGVKYISGCEYKHMTNGYTPHELDSEYRTLVKMNSGKLIYSFYSDIENMIVLPTIGIYPNTSCKITLDFGVKQAEVQLVTALYDNSSNTGIVENSYSVAAKADAIFNYKKFYLERKEIPLMITNKGWHTLIVEPIGEFNFHGLEFLSASDWIYQIQGNYEDNDLIVGSKKSEIKRSAILNRKVGNTEVDVNLCVTATPGTNGVFTIDMNHNGTSTNRLDITDKSMRAVNNMSLGDNSYPFKNAMLTGFMRIGTCTNATRPTEDLTRGAMIFDSTVNKVIIWNGSKWVDVMGAVV